MNQKSLINKAISYNYLLDESIDFINQLLRFITHNVKPKTYNV